jgi:hypothetical protein
MLAGTVVPAGRDRAGARWPARQPAKHADHRSKRTGSRNTRAAWTGSATRVASVDSARWRGRASENLRPDRAFSSTAGRARRSGADNSRTTSGQVEARRSGRSRIYRSWTRAVGSAGPDADDRLLLYFVDGAEVTAFEPLLASGRRGSEPDRFPAQMRQASLDTDPVPQGAPAPPVTRSPRLAHLEMLTWRWASGCPARSPSGHAPQLLLGSRIICPACTSITSQG